MGMKQEIFKAFFVAFGAMEIITNANYLFQGKLESARKQHQEIPKDVTSIQLKNKVLTMLIFGAIFLMVGLFSYLSHQYIKLMFCISLILFSLYAISEAIYYRFWRTTAFSVLSVMVTVICFI